MHDDFYQMYLEELEGIKEFEEGEEALLLGRLAGGNDKAKNRLIEGNLKRVLEFAKEYENQGVIMNDLVQEANMALMLAVGSYQGGDFKEQLEREVRCALEAAVEEQKQEHNVEEEMLARVNVLQEVSKVMAGELGREATVDELAAKMKMTADEIKDIMKVALDAIHVSEASRMDFGEEEEE